MAKFPTTQEELDEIVKERLTRERAKFSDYDELKQAAETHQAEVDSLKAQLEEAKKAGNTALEKAIAEHKQAMQEKDAALAAAKLGTEKFRIAAAVGIPPELADRLSGANEDEIKADAENMAKFIQRGAPARNPEPGSAGTDGHAALLSMARSIIPE